MTPHVFCRYGEWRVFPPGLAVYRRLTASGVTPFGERLSEYRLTRRRRLEAS